MILIIDNYDSFTYNLYQYVGEIDSSVKVFRNDEITIGDIERMSPSHIIISPGPGHPSDSGICPDVIKHFAGRIPILGVCLGHQAIGKAYGGIIVGAGEIVHGKTSLVEHDGKGIFKYIESPVKAMRYHSLVVKPGSANEELVVAARDESGNIMAFRHREHPLYGLQFHPESIGTDSGKGIIENFIRIKI